MIRQNLGSHQLTAAPEGRLRGACRVYAGLPEYWGRDSPYHPGTDFLGTPKNHLEVSGGGGVGSGACVFQ